MLKRTVLMAVSAALAVSCQDSGLLEVETDDVDDALLAISDGEHTGGTPGFFFLPPLVPQPRFDGEFDPDLSVTVEVCEFVDPGCGDIIETFDDLPVADDHYRVDWHTKQSDLVEGVIYRLVVRVESRQLGFVDLVARKKVSGKKQGSDPFPLKIGRTLPVKLRIEMGIVAQVVVAPADATIKDNETQEYTATVTDFHGVPVSGVTVEWSIGDETVATLDPTTGTTNDDGETVTTATPPASPTLETPTTVRAVAQEVEGIATLTLEPSTFPPTAVDDSHSMTRGATLNVGAGAGLLANDDVGNPASLVNSFGGGSLGGAVTDNTAGSSVALAGGTLTVNADGSFDLVAPTGVGAFTFDYRITNPLGSSDATVTIGVETPPTVSSTSPAAGAVGQAIDVDLTVTFSEPVTVTGEWFEIVCTTSGTRNVSDATVTGGPSTFTIDPNADFAEGESCTTTIFAAQVADQDGAPDNMAADFIFTFATDVAPEVVSTTPADGATNVLPTDPVTIDFSESVNATLSSFTIECPAPGNLQAFSLSGSPASSFTLTPNSNLPAGTTCTVTVIAAQITDPMAADFTFSFTLPVVANNDNYPEGVVGNVSVNSADVSGGAFSVTDNDEANNPLTITAFDATSANGGTVTMVTSGPNIGQFTYDPPLGFEGSDAFNYTIGDGSTSDAATVTMTVADMVWFVDNNAAAGDGRLSSPFNTLAAFNTANAGSGSVPDPKDGDVVFLYESGSAYLGGVTLRSDQKLIGQDATSSLSALTGTVPAASSAPFPTMNSANPTIVHITSGLDGVVLAQDNDVRGLTIGNTTGAGLKGSTFGTLTVGDVSINGGGQALDLTTGAVSATFDVLTSTSSAGRGINLDGVTGSVTHSAASSIAGSTTEAVRINGGVVTFTYDGDITNSGNGIVLTGNSGQMDFGGTLTLAPVGPNTAFRATGGGQITADGSGSTINTGAVTALEISNTTIGSGGVTFRSISSNGGSTGIVLNNAGSGGFTITGTGTTDGSGGTIQSKTVRGIQVIGTDNVAFSNMAFTSASTTNGATCTGLDNSGCNAAVYLNAVTNASLSNVDITGITAQQGINGLNVTGFTLSGGTITGAGNQVNEGGVRMFNLSGTVTVSGVLVESSSERNFYVRNNFPGPTTLTMSVANSTFSDTQSSGFGADGLEVELLGMTTLDLDVTNSTFLRNRTNGIQVIAAGNSVANSVDITGNVIDPVSGIGKAIDLATNNNGQMNFNVISNPTIWSHGGTALNVRAFASSAIAGRIQSNPDIQTNRNGSGGGNGISVGAEDNSTIVVDISNNSVSNIFQDIGIQTFSRSGTGTMDATINNNTIVLQGGGAFPLYGVEVRAQNGNTTCVNVTNNSVTLGNGVAAFRERTSNSGSTVLLQGFVSTSNVTADVTTVWNSSNTPTGSVSASNNGTVGGGTCNTPSNPLP